MEAFEDELRARFGERGVSLSRLDLDMGPPAVWHLLVIDTEGDPRGIEVAVPEGADPTSRRWAREMAAQVSERVRARAGAR